LDLATSENLIFHHGNLLDITIPVKGNGHGGREKEEIE